MERTMRGKGERKRLENSALHSKYTTQPKSLVACNPTTFWLHLAKKKYERGMPASGSWDGCVVVPRVVRLTGLELSPHDNPKATESDVSLLFLDSSNAPNRRRLVANILQLAGKKTWWA